MTISSAQFRHDDVFLQEHFAPPPRRPAEVWGHTWRLVPGQR